MTAQGDHFSHSGKATVSLCEPVGQDQRISEAHGEHKGHSPAGSRGRSQPAFNANFRWSVEKQVHRSFPQRANHLVTTQYGASIRNARANNLNFGAKFKHLAYELGARYQSVSLNNRKHVLDFSASMFANCSGARPVEHSGAQS